MLLLNYDLVTTDNRFQATLLSYSYQLKILFAPHISHIILFFLRDKRARAGEGGCMRKVEWGRVWRDKENVKGRYFRKRKRFVKMNSLSLHVLLIGF